MAKHIMDDLFQVVESRRGGDPESSRTAKLFARGRLKIAQKVGEEAVEAVIEAVADDHDRLVSESADLLYHLLVLWSDSGVKPDEVWDELKGRRGTPGSV